MKTKNQIEFEFAQKLSEDILGKLSGTHDSFNEPALDSRPSVIINYSLNDKN
jgi:hypothetical protein